MNKFQTIFEKLLPARYWKKRPPINDEQFWNALNAPVNPQTLAVLHTVQDKFVVHMASASDTEAPDAKRLRALDRAMAIADVLNEVEDNLAVAKDVVARREQGPGNAQTTRG